MISVVLPTVGVLLHPAIMRGDEGLCKTPTLGWNSWNGFHGALNETVVRETARLLVATGWVTVRTPFDPMSSAFTARRRVPVFPP